MPPSGIVCPLATPLTDDEDLDHAALRRLVDFVLPSVDGILVLGSSGERALLRQDVAARTVDAVLELVAGRLPVHVGVSDAGTKRTLENVWRLPATGVETVFVTGPYYYSSTGPLELPDHFLGVAEASRLPIVLYNVPQNTGSSLTADAVRLLAEHPNIVGIKDSSGDMFLFQELLAATTAGFSVMQGREQLAAASLWLGASGIISAVANLAPGLLKELVRAVGCQDRSTALVLQRKISALSLVFSQIYWLSALKTALAELGIGTGRVSRPLPSASAEDRRRIGAILQAAGLASEAATRSPAAM